MSSDDIRHSAESPPPRPVPLTFHKLLDHFSFSANNYTPEKLERLLCNLRNGGLRISARGEDRPPDVLLTFDDGYEHYRDTLPSTIERFAVRPLIFVPTAWIGLPNRWDYSHRIQPLKHLSREGIRELAGVGARFGAHGHRHRVLNGLSAEDIREELQTARQILEDLLGTEVDCISYPFGRASKQVQELAAECGYRSGYLMSPPAQGEALLGKGRVPVLGFDSYRAILKRITGTGSRWEQVKTQAAFRLSGGTILLNRLRRFTDYPV